MILELQLKNLVLVDFAKITFSKELNIITGETGSGKSALLSGIKLIKGAKADTTLIGKNGDLAAVEATLLEGDKQLIIRREISKSGKSRLFINDELSTLAELKNRIDPLIELVDQSSALSVLEESVQREALDLASNTTVLLKEYEKSFSEKNQLQKEIDELNALSETKEKDLAWAIEDLDLIEKASWNEGEDESLLRSHKEITSKMTLKEDLEKLVEDLERIHLPTSRLERLSSGHDALERALKHLKSAKIEIDEAEDLIFRWTDSLNENPEELFLIEERLSLIEQVQRRFGRSFSEVQEKKVQLQEKIEKLQDLDRTLSEKKKHLERVSTNCQNLADQLSQKRKMGKEKLKPLLLQEMQSLDLPSSRFEIEMKKKVLSKDGQDTITFTFSANMGHELLPLNKSASGGELSRILLSLKTTLSNLQKKGTLIFDEVDSNVGGSAGAALGERLKALSKTRQVIAVTHFVQVAKHATSHFAVSKKEMQNQTFSQIENLSGEGKEHEYQRMLGERRFTKKQTNEYVWDKYT